MKTCIVAPCHIQPSQEWISALKTEADNAKADVIIVDDSGNPHGLGLPKEFKIFKYGSQKDYFDNFDTNLYPLFERFHKSSSCKQFGLFYAYQEGYDYTIVIDSDCIVKPDFVALHIKFMEAKGDGWINPITETNLYSRGFPYSQRMQDKWCHMGLWTNELDLYGKDRVGNNNIPKEFLPRFAYNPAPGFFPLSGMNLCFTRDALPFMLFLPNFVFGDEKFIRHDDIFGGYIFQKIARLKNKCLSFGLPMVFHDTEVDPVADARQEEPMIKYEDKFYALVDKAISYDGNYFANIKLIMRGTEFDNLDSAFLFQLLAYKDVYANL